MATSDRGLVDLERFDLEPSRPIFHGLLGDVDTATLAGLTNREKSPCASHHRCGQPSARGAASLIEVGHTLSTWPQLAVTSLGASAVAEAVRRISLGEPLSSGRVRVDMGAALDDLTDPAVQHADPRVDLRWPDAARRRTVRHRRRSPPGKSSAVGSNAQPWNIEAATTRSW
jgi:hypothetical protein